MNSHDTAATKNAKIKTKNCQTSDPKTFLSVAPT